MKIGNTIELELHIILMVSGTLSINNTSRSNVGYMFQESYWWPCWSTPAPGFLAHRVSGHLQGPTQDPPRDPKTSGEWNTTSARRQVQTPDIWAPSLQEESLPAESTLTTETKDRASLPGLLIEANIIT